MLKNLCLLLYIDYYDALHILAEAFLQFENRKIANHQCLFAFLCKNHPELEFDWYFFEEIRFNRNGAHYYGKKITYEDWEKAKLKFNLYISALKKEIEKRLGSSLWKRCLAIISAKNVWRFKHAVFICQWNFTSPKP